MLLLRETDKHRTSNEEKLMTGNDWLSIMPLVITGLMMLGLLVVAGLNMSGRLGDMASGVCLLLLSVVSGIALVALLLC